MKKFFENFSWLGMIMLCLCVILGVGDLSGAVYAADAVATDVATNGEAQPSPANEKGTMLSAGERSALATWDYRKWAPDLIKDPVEREVIQCRSYATPLDTILSYIGSEKINNLQFKYWQIGDSILSDKVLAFECPGNTSEDKVVAYIYLDGTHTNTVHANDNLLVTEEVTGSTITREELYLFVQKVEFGVEKTINDTPTSTVKLTVTADAEQVTKVDSLYKIPAIAANTMIYVCGNAHNELDVTSPDIEFVPTEKKGYAQIFKREITISNYAQMADKEFKWDLNEIERETVFRWKKEKEMAFLFGRMSKVYDAAGHEVLRTAGVFRTVLAWQKKNHAGDAAYLANGAYKVDSTVSTAKAASDEFIDMMKAIFVGNNGNTERFGFAGPSAIAKLSKMMAVGVQKNQDAEKTEVVAGITFTKIVSKFGVLNLISHPLFEETPYADYLMVIDPQFLKKKEVLPVDRQEVDGREHLIINGKIVILSETSGVAVYNPDAHKVIKFV